MSITSIIIAKFSELISTAVTSTDRYEANTTVVNRLLSWLIGAASTITKKVVFQVDFLKVQQKLVEYKADAEEVKRMPSRCCEAKKDEVRAKK